MRGFPREKLRRSCLRPAADKTKLPVRTREKTSGTQCIEIHDSKAYLYLNFSVISKLTNVETLSKYKPSHFVFHWHSFLRKYHHLVEQLFHIHAFLRVRFSLLRIPVFKQRSRILSLIKFR